jgi:hypothetical protein
MEENGVHTTVVEERVGSQKRSCLLTETAHAAWVGWPVSANRAGSDGENE